MNVKPQTQAEVDSAEKVLRLIWIIVAGAVIFSVLNVTPLVQRVTPDNWDWTAPILPIVVDVAVIIVVRVDAIVTRLGGRSRGWPAVLRWLTGAMTLGLNIGDSALDGSWVGIAVHAGAPALLIVTAEAALKYRESINKAVERIAREQADEQAARERKQEERERLAAEERERERESRERSERAEGERRERLERERLAREQSEQQAARDHALNMERERLAAEERERAAERDERRARWEAEQAREREAEQLKRQQEESERRLKEARERELKATGEHRAGGVHERPQPVREQPDAAPREQAPPAVRERREQPKPAVRERSKALVHKPRERAAKPAVNASERLPEAEARELVIIGVATGATVRELADETGWSTGWVSQRMNEIREQDPSTPEPVSA
ncbi:DUF2637 domain-containing protein [Streptomyces lydicus]|uniref:DUF2637 domain-containing protein n=1 Tax=Streptomyces lydicus TaxID=47763 RepID=UPI003794BA4F